MFWGCIWTRTVEKNQTNAGISYQAGHLRNAQWREVKKCNQCDFASPRAGNLRTHLKTNIGEKPNKCDQCDYASSQASNLRTHLMTHCGENATNVALHLHWHAIWGHMWKHRDMHLNHHQDYHFVIIIRVTQTNKSKKLYIPTFHPPPHEWKVKVASKHSWFWLRSQSWRSRPQICWATR